MTGYVCKYAPIEIFAGFDEKIETISSASASSDTLHPNLCCFAKKVFDGCPSDIFLSAGCCDSLRRAADAMENDGRTVFRCTVPHAVNNASKELFAAEILSLIGECEKHFGRRFDTELFLKAFCETAEKDTEHIAVMGARIDETLLGNIEKISPLPVSNITCSDKKRPAKPENISELSSMIFEYASNLLDMPPCMRMADIQKRKELLSGDTKGIIYHTVKFCDFYTFELSALPSGIPHIHIETEYDSVLTGQMETRLEAFFENNFSEKNYMNTDKNGKYYIGIDSGSTSTAAVVIDNNGNIAASYMLPTGAKSGDTAKKAYNEAAKKVGDSIAESVATGYGRKSIERGKDITEITCHAAGVYHEFPKAKTIIDIGGQDSKVIILGKNGSVADFSMNDKCAAGTGRFFELMASTLGITLAELSSLGHKCDEKLTISSMCAVFAESEVVSLIAQDKKTDDIVYALDNAIAARICGMARRLNAAGPYVLTGGVAKNKGLVLALERELKEKILIPKEPQLTGALGAALIARG